MKQKNIQAFTMVELLVAMAIIGLLIATAIWGIGTAQVSARNTQRRVVGGEILAGMSEFYARYNKQPAFVCWDSANNAVKLSSTSLCPAAGLGISTYSVPVSNTSPSMPNTTNLVISTGIPLTSAASTKYIVRTSATSVQFTGSLVCACMEGGGFANLSETQVTGQTVCQTECP